ncbi:MAG: hypothetical protein VYA67_09830 [Actinomycetota bacterium]|nr:hypothetical protein [Actinomycetota bacterium]
MLDRRMLDRRRRVLHRGLLRRLMDHRSARTAVAAGTARASTLEDRAGVRRRRRVSADTASGTAAALDYRGLSSRPGRAVSADAATAGNTAAERRALLAEDAAVCSGAGTRVDTAAGSAGRKATTDAGPRGTVSSGVAA